MTRVTHQSITRSSLHNLQASLQRVSKVQEQMTTGRVLNRPSDDPSGTVDAMSMRADLRQRDQHLRAASDGTGSLGAVDTALGDVSSILNRVKQLALNAASTGANGTTSREADAVEIASLREQLLTVANTTYQGRPVFGGTTGGSVAFDATGAYVGTPVSGSPSDPAAPGAVTRVVGPGVKVRVDEPGPAAFGDGASSVFALLDRVAADVRAGTAGTSGVLTELDTAASTAVARRADVGARYARVETATQAAKDAKVSVTSSLAAVENIDLPKAVLELQMQQVSYQAALGATAKVIQPTLMDFLR